jgi:CheY-like chemotaxis protein
VIRVLHIDDEAPIRLLSRVNLESEGMEVIEAADGRIGLELAKREQPDVILLGVMMPAMDGWQVAEELRKDPETWKIPVVFLTARAALRDRVRGFHLGAVDYIAKPFNPTELAPRLRGLLERLERGGWHELRRENIILDVLARSTERPRTRRGLKAFRQMCESAITVYDGTEEGTRPTKAISSSALRKRPKSPSSATSASAVSVSTPRRQRGLATSAAHGRCSAVSAIPARAPRSASRRGRLRAGRCRRSAARPCTRSVARRATCGA